VSTYRILFLGDVVGKPGRKAVQEALPSLQDTHQPLFTVINGENSAAGLGITTDIAEELYRWGADAITLGNHAYNKRDIYPFLDTPRPIVRPENLPKGCPGRGSCVVTKDGIDLHVWNVCGRVFLDGYGDPFEATERLLTEATGPHILLDFHAEATSEKIAMGFHMDGRVSAVVGTHTHVTTADETILPSGTAYITDVGMCGPYLSVLGMDRELILRRFRTTMPEKFEVQDGHGYVSGVVIEVERDSGRSVAIERVRFDTLG
jgi:metallophosphoesterase (TIGR00282 family)